MSSLNAALLINLLGFSVGIALYGLLAVMVARHRRSSETSGVNYLLLATAALGLLWNLGELIVSIQRDFGYSASNGFLTAAAYSALGFLPSVVVHSAQSEKGRSRVPVWLAYSLSTAAAVLHLRSAFAGEVVPSVSAMQTLTLGALTLSAILIFFNFRDTIERKAIWAATLLIFAVSSLHLTGESKETSWAVELIAHQSSLPLALTILYQNFRFAFADLFLKRAISLILVTLVAFGLYVAVAAPLLRYHETHDRNDVFAVSLLLTLWIGTALLYPLLHRFAVWLVDRIVLRRADFEAVQTGISKDIEGLDSIREIMETVTGRLAQVLTASVSTWSEADSDRPRDGAVVVNVDTAEFPKYRMELSDFSGGRRLLSDERAMMNAVGLIAARKIDSLRVIHERCELEIKEQEYSKLAAEAQLKALRSQINPHFLFNALTTIGYLIETSPEKALHTLMHLTKLLRGALSSATEFSTLGDEMDLIENYLDIERARFEEKLDVKIDVPRELRLNRIPSLILQPLVENAIKHGISENRNGGKLEILAEVEPDGRLCLAVRDTGASRKLKEITSGGVGLANVRERLHAYYGDTADLALNFNRNGWTSAELRMPLSGGIRKAA